MRSLLPLQRLNRLQRVPQSPVRRRPAAGPAIVTQAYAFDGATTDLRATLTGLSYPTGLTLAMHCTRVTYASSSPHYGTMLESAQEFLQVRPSSSDRAFASYRDAGGGGGVLSQAVTGTGADVDDAGYQLITVSATAGGGVRVSQRGPAQDRTAVVTTGGAALGATIDELVVAARLAGVDLIQTTVAHIGIFADDLDAADRAALYADGRAHDWRPLAAAEGLTLSHYYRLDQAYDDGSVRVPDDGVVGGVIATITAGDLADLTSTVPTGVAP